MTFNFADSYRVAGLNPGHDTLKLRQEPFDSLLNNIDVHMAIKLIRIYFGLPSQDNAEWFRAAFGETDTSFSLIDNAREAAVLASGLLNAAMDNGESYAALAVLTTAAGNREPIVRDNLIQKAINSLNQKSISERQHTLKSASTLKVPQQIKTPEEFDSTDLEQVAKMMQKHTDEIYNIVKNIVSQARNIITPLHAEVDALREEVEILWWHIGGWSRILEKPFSELDLAVSASMAGLDLAALIHSSTGPAAAPAILHRTIYSGRQSDIEKITVAEMANSFHEESLKLLKIDFHQLSNNCDIFPTLTALAKASEIGVGDSWFSSYEKLTNLNPNDISFKPLELAMQVYREHLLLSVLTE